MLDHVNAIIMAAGKGERLRPLTLTTPKPLIKINGVPMIENIIEALLSKGIKEIVVVVGYLKESFFYLKEKYGVVIIENPDYEKANNISSLYYARDYLGNSLIMDGDQIINDNSIFDVDFINSGYMCWKINSFSPEWILELSKDNKIIECHRDGFDKGCELKSISYWDKNDSHLLKELLVTEYINNNNTSIYWDDVAMFLHKDLFRLYGYIINDGDVIEIDSVDELKKIEESYKL